jgi:hypothetical protein
MRRLFLFLAVVLCLQATATAQTKESAVPAGTLLQCTLDEPNFSSQTAHVGDPVVCHISSLGMFGRPVFPRGAYLSGRFTDFRDPGHFFGKGWLTLEFETLTLPGGTFPLSAKVVSVPHYIVDAEGSIRGRGHPRRDAIEWAIPILWPEKVITLPMRSPRPTLKGETRILLRVQEDVSIPTNAADTLIAMLSKPALPGVVSNGSLNTAREFSPRILYGGTRMPGAEAEVPFSVPPPAVERMSASELNRPTERPWHTPRATFLILKDGQGYVVTSYWIEAGQLVYVGAHGARQALSLDDLDFQMTVRLNWERGVPFVLRPGVTEPRATER